jgi:chromosome segregation ATPase
LQAAQLAVSQAQAGVQAAERQVSEANATVAGTQTAIAGVQARQQAIQQQITGIANVTTEIDRDPITRPTVEQLAAELSARVFELEDAHTQARLEQEDAEERLSSLIARRDDLTQRVADATTRLPDAQAKLESALRTLAETEANVTAAFEEGPL